MFVTPKLRLGSRACFWFIMPNGRSIVLERQQGADRQAGSVGLENEVDNDWRELLKAAALSTLLGVGAELGSSANDSYIIRALRRGSGNSFNQTGQQVVRHNLNIQESRAHGGRKGSNRHLLMVARIDGRSGMPCARDVVAHRRAAKLLACGASAGPMNR